MSILGNLIFATAHVLNTVLEIYMWIIVIAALISWVNPDPYNPIVRFLHSVTDPVLRPIRRRLGVWSGIDVSPLIVILLIVFLKKFIIVSMFEIAYKIKGG